MRAQITVLVGLALLAVPATPVLAQSSRVSLGVSGGSQVTETQFTDSFTFALHRETGSTQVQYPIARSALFDVSAGVQLWRNFGAGLAISRSGRDNPATTVSSMPHPLYFDEHREIAGTIDNARRDEIGIHLQARYQLPIARDVWLVLTGGPSILRVTQSVVTAVRHTETYPYDTADFTGATTRRAQSSATGLNLGADLRWMFSRYVGAGAMIRRTRANVRIDAAQNRTLPIDAGGTHIGVGLRVAF